MDRTYLQEAFKQMDLLEEEVFPISGNSTKDILDFAENDELANIIDVFDPEAETEEEIKDSYIGDVVLECEVCHSPIFKAVEEVAVDETTGLANVEDECPICHSNDGFTIIGQIAPYAEEPEIKVEIEDKPEEAESDVDFDIVDEDTAEEENTEEEIEDAEEDTEEIHEAVSSDKGAVYYAFQCEICNPSSGSAHPKAWDKDGNKLEAEYWVYKPENVDHFSDFEDIVLQDYGYDVACDNQDELDYLLSVVDFYGLTFEGMKRGKNGRKFAKITAAELPQKWDTKVSGAKIFKERGGTFEDPNAIAEGFEKIDLETEDKVIHVSEEEKEPIPDAEMITPVSDELEAELLSDEDIDDIPEEPVEEQEEPLEDDVFDEEPVEEMSDEDTIDYDFEDFEEDDFDELGESYLKSVYDNVKSFKTSAASVDKNTLFIEGIIEFNSGRTKNTKFVFEAADATNTGRVRFTGMNEQFSKGKKSFTLTGTIKGNKLVTEALNYNYRVKDSEGKSTRVYGTARTARNK